MRCEKVKQGDLKLADQIAVMGNVADLDPSLLRLTAHIGETYFHHGIYDPNNVVVYHFTGDNKANAKPKKSDFTEFFAGKTQLYRVVYDDNEECLPDDEVMKKAEEAVEGSSTWPDYHIIANNCESFATYLKTGEAYSKQALEGLVRFAEAAFEVASDAVGRCSVSISGSLGGSTSTLS